MKKKVSVPAVVFLTLSVVIAVMIFFFSSQAGPETNDTSSGVAEKIAKLIFFDYNELNSSQQSFLTSQLNGFVRKSAHFGIYALLGFIVLTNFRFFNCKMKTSVPISVIICMLYATSDELHQSFVPGRSACFSDVMLDSVGAFTGIVVALVAFACIDQMRLCLFKSKSRNGE